MTFDEFAEQAVQKGYGGQHVKWKTALPNKHSRLLQKALQTLVLKTCGAQGEASPKTDAKRLVRELVTQRVALSRTKRETLEKRYILVLIDASGSCAGVCEEFLTAAQAIQERDDRVLLVIHSNGIPLQYIERGQVQSTSFPTDETDETVLLQPYLSFLRGRALGLVLAFGDGDAVEVYRHFVERGSYLVWLDSYCKRYGVRNASRTLKAGLEPWIAAHNVAYIQGVGDTPSTLEAFHLLQKNKPWA